MEGLGFDNIFGETDIENLFTNEETAEETAGTPDTEEISNEEGKEKNDDTDKTTEVDPDNLFGEEEEEKPESVGSEKKEDTEEKEGSSTDDSGGTSPENFYSSIANAVAEDGVFPNLDKETIEKANDAESFSKLFDLEVEARLDETQKRIARALDDGVEPTDIKRYENVLANLSRITEQQVSVEGEQAEKLRYDLIYQDFINKGLSPEKADKLAKRSIDSGSDIEDAKEALQNNREFFQKQYNDLLDKAHKDAEAEKAERKKQTEKMKDSILNDKTLMGDMEVTGELRRKVFENITKPVYKDPETGEYLTSIQKYEREHSIDFLKYAGLFYTLTNGFKDFDNLAKGKVKKEIKKGLSELEKTLNGTRRNPNGSLRMVTSVKEDPESFIEGGFKLDI